MTRSRILLILAGLLVGIIGGTAQAGLILTQGSSSVTIDHTLGGVDSWTINGKENIDNEWFWMQVGATGTAHKVGSIGSVSETQVSSTIGLQTFTTPDYSLEVLWKLADTGGGLSQLTENLTLTNVSSSTKNYRLFEFTDFDLFGGLIGSVVPTTNSGGKYVRATQTSTNGTVGEVGMLDTYAADRYEATTAHGALIPLIETPGGYNLANTVGTVGPGDVEFALQWNRTVTVGNSVTLAKSKTISPVVPEAGTVILFGLGILGVGLTRRFRKV
jgi:hypothetical protein